MRSWSMRLFVLDLLADLAMLDVAVARAGPLEEGPATGVIVCARACS